MCGTNGNFDAISRYVRASLFMEFLRGAYVSPRDTASKQLFTSEEFNYFVKDAGIFGLNYSKLIPCWILSIIGSLSQL